MDIYEQDLIRTDLRINATTESHLRLKTLSDFGLTDINGIPVQSLTLTESFQRYAPAYIRNEAYIPVLISSPSPSVYVTVNPTTGGQTIPVATIPALPAPIVS